MKNIKVGIEKINAYIPEYYVDLEELAVRRDVPVTKWTIGIGQDKMAIIPNSQDIVSMGANAAYEFIVESDKTSIDQIIFATESGIDFSKAASTYLQELLDINGFVRAYEIKQACYSTTAALQIAKDYVTLNPDRKVLVVSADIANYGKETSSEVTQGAGAVALLISSNPEILEITQETVFSTANEYDFWRPNNHDYPLVDGKYSIDIYNNAFKKCFYEFDNKYGNLDELEAMVFHLPFTKMQKKALESVEEDKYADLQERWSAHFTNNAKLCRNIGNIYSGSLYLSLISLLHYGDLEAGKKIGLFSYGSGAVGELFTGILGENYKEKIALVKVDDKLARRQAVSLDDYDDKYFTGKLVLEDNSHFKLNEIIDDKRTYSV